MAHRLRRCLAVAAGITGLVAAGLGMSGTAAAAAPPAGQVDARVIGAMGRDMHLDAARATALLATEQAAGRTERDLRGALGTRFAGAWLAEGAGKLIVGITDPAQAGRVRAAGAEPRIVKHSEGELTAAKSTLDKSARPAASAVSGWYVDPVSNSVVVNARPGATAAAGEFVKASGADPASVRIVSSTEAPRLLDREPFGVYGGDQLAVPLGICSIGFTIIKYGSYSGWVTAGHCGRTGDPVTPGFNLGATGTIRGSTFPGNDMAILSHDNFDFDFGAFGMPVANAYQVIDDVRVEGLTEAPVGASICRSGVSSGFRCGRILARNQTVNYPEGTVVGLARTSACGAPGDSGGPFLAGGQAQGVLSGGSGNCFSGGVTFFQPLNPILRTYGAKLLSVNGVLDPLP